MLTYRYSPIYVFATPDGRDALPALKDAMVKWAKSGLVAFSPMVGDKRIFFEFGPLDDGVIAHTYLPTQEDDYTRIVFNEETDWSLATGWWRLNPFTFGYESLLQVFCHELGHVLGLVHAPNNANSVMIHNDDVNGIHQAPFPTKWDFEQLKKRLA
jgi:hypothetical protein